ncbi:MAG: DNA alkylation repair protein [Salinivirgaceae bacterium]|jgi:3-methyladenine DNA glycosylase AlkD|nr:DNA alkylation repair protein [Salinivirgaceae bacterium]
MVDQIIAKALSSSEPDRINLFKQYFKCIPGGYGEGDTFAGIKNPFLKNIAKANITISSAELTTLLKHKVHEIRLLALYIFQFKFNNKKTSINEKAKLVDIYLKHTKYINNWDLVDVSAYHVLGQYFFEKESDVLLKLANSSYLWDNRIAIIATFYHIRKNSFNLTLQIAEVLLTHQHDIIHKAVGWMLREIGNRNQQVELDFLKIHYKNMPRTMLRYAIEKFDKTLRQEILKGTF